MSTQFRVLFRQFLFRLTDVELLSAHAQGDSTRLLGQFASLLIFTSILFTLPAFGVPAKDAHPQARLLFDWTSQHLLIATTMLVTGLFAVLSWESTFPDKRDVFVLGPLPVAARTMFGAKIAGVAAALGITICALHAAAGLVWPFSLNSEAPEHIVPSFRADPPEPAGDLRSTLARDLAPMLRQHPEAGIVAGVLRGDRQVLAFGAAKPDSIFEIGSVTKTFTGLLLARMAAEHRVRLDQPVRELLPEGIARRPSGAEITLLDLATHRSGLPRMPPGFRPRDKENPFADFHDAELHSYMTGRGVSKRGRPPFLYSNLGFGLLGQVLAARAGQTYADSMREFVCEPLGLRDTSVVLSSDQRVRLIQGHDWHHRPVRAWDLDAIAGAGALHSTAGDMVSYLAAQLDPGPAPVLAHAIRESQQIRAKIGGGPRMSLAWFHDEGAYVHSGATAGYTAYTYFKPSTKTAVVVLSNTGASTAISADMIGEHVLARLEGRPAVAIENMRIPARGGVWRLIRSYAVHWAILFSAGTFVYCCVLCLQGLASHFLPRRLFLRASSGLQLLTFCALVAAYLLQPLAVYPASVVAAQSGGAEGWSPSYWFLGLYQHWSGSPALAALATRAYIASGIVLMTTTLVWTLSYFHTMRRIVEEPDIVPGGAGLLRLPAFGGPLETAIAHFSIRTLLRSQRHRMILAFFTGVAFAISIFFAKTPVAQEEIAEIASGNPWREPSSPILAATMVILGFWIVAVRIAFALPLEIGANWIFRVTPLRAGPRALKALRRAMYSAALAPPWVCCTAVLVVLWPWQAALGHALVLGLPGGILVELCLLGPLKIPFTCSYLPGKTNIHVTFWICTMLLMKILDTGAAAERRALEDPTVLLGLLAVLCCVALALRRWVARAASNEESFQYEEEAADAIRSLGLG